MTTIINGSTGVSLVQDGTITSAKILDGSVAPVDLAQKLTLGTAQDTTSGTSIDFTGIPSWAKRITVMLNGVSTNGTSITIIQLGSTTVTTTGYLGAGNTSATVANGTSGILTAGDSLASYVRHGSAVLTNISGNTWVGSAYFGLSDSTRFAGGGGSVTLSGVLDRVRITTVNGTDLFDAGSVNILYEG
jgi:hypothetical protein